MMGLRAGTLIRLLSVALSCASPFAAAAELAWSTVVGVTVVIVVVVFVSSIRYIFRSGVQFNDGLK